MIVPQDNEKKVPVKDELFPDLTPIGDPALRLVARLIQKKDFRQLEQRVGIRRPPPDATDDQVEEAKRTLFLPVLIQLNAQPRMPVAASLSQRYQIPAAYLRRQPVPAFITARLPLDPDVYQGSTASLLHGVQELRAIGIERFCLGPPGQPSKVRESLEDLGLPHDRIYNNKPPLTGKGVIIGIIDDGCAVAHGNFLKPRAKNTAAASRILHLWDQGRKSPAGGWQPVAGYYGYELDTQTIDAALNAHKIGDLIREDMVHQHLNYRLGEVATHGTHVMDIAAGNGQSVMGIEGAAPEADIIFVQLPRWAIDEGATALWRYVRDGAEYIFQKAQAAGKPAVVNISYGGYDGPHDGTSQLEVALDEYLNVPDRAIVIAAGNSFESRCHAMKTVPKNGTDSLRWIINGADPTANDLEIWHEEQTLEFRLTPPRGTIVPAGWISLGTSGDITLADGSIIGSFEYHLSDTGNGAYRIVISLNATDAEANSGDDVPAASGTWTVDLRNSTNKDADVHAWIWRDDAGSARNARIRQSRFRPDDAHPEYTIAGWATGHRTISVGAYNRATKEICGYSSCGPTRPIGGKKSRKKPEVYAPAEEEVRGHGILSASALSARPTRMNGTSAAAPHITGLIALMFEYAWQHAAGKPKHLTAAQIAKELRDTSSVNVLRFNRRQEVDARVRVKQHQVRANLVAAGKGEFVGTMDQLPQ